MLTPSDTLRFAAYRTFNGLAPKELPKALTLALDFSAETSYVIDLEHAETEARLSLVQSVFVDNSVNAEQFSLTVSISGQVLRVPASAQAYLPVLAPSGAKFIAALKAVGTGITTISFLNFPVPAAVWTP